MPSALIALVLALSLLPMRAGVALSRALGATQLAVVAQVAERPAGARERGERARGERARGPRLRRAGAQVVVSAEAEVAMAMAEHLLRQLGATADQLDRVRDSVRQELAPGGA